MASWTLGCDRGEPSSARASPAPQSPEFYAELRLDVFAAASLRDVFTVLGDELEREHPGLDIAFNFAGTQELCTQLEHGAQVDVFASADPIHMQTLLTAARVHEPIVFAHNQPVIVVPLGNTTVRGLEDLPSVQRLVVGTAEVPIGRYTLRILQRASEQLGADFAGRVQARVVSRELNVRQVLAKVLLGEAEAGIVYQSDAQAAQGKLRVVPIASAFNVVAQYPIAVVRTAAHPQRARQWVQRVLSERGASALRAAGLVPARAERAP